jgi:hypothetical protein
MCLIAFPSQGLCNFLIYIRPRYLTVRKSQPRIGRLRALMEAVWYPSGRQGAASNGPQHRSLSNRMMRLAFCQCFPWSHHQEDGAAVVTSARSRMASGCIPLDLHTPSGCFVAANLDIPSRRCAFIENSDDEKLSDNAASNKLDAAMTGTDDIATDGPSNPSTCELQGKRIVEATSSSRSMPHSEHTGEERYCETQSEDNPSSVFWVIFERDESVPS